MEMLFWASFGNVFIKTSNYQAGLWCNVFSSGSAVSSFHFSSPFLFFFSSQLSESPKKRNKRQVVVDDENNEPMIIEPQAAITLPGLKKLDYLLVRNKWLNCLYAINRGFIYDKVFSRLTGFPFRCLLKDCSKGTARCVNFTCPLLNMTNSARIDVRARLWNSTMLEVSSESNYIWKVIVNVTDRYDCRTLYTQFSVYIKKCYVCFLAGLSQRPDSEGQRSRRTEAH